MLWRTTPLEPGAHLDDVERDVLPREVVREERLREHKIGCGRGGPGGFPASLERALELVDLPVDWGRRAPSGVSELLRAVRSSICKDGRREEGGHDEELVVDHYALGIVLE